jgi:4'-phosphopantetheinyl transferase
MRAESPPDVTLRRADHPARATLPAADEVHLWVADLDPGPAEAARRFAATTGAERERAARFRRPRHAEHYLSAHGALRLVLADALACDPHALRIGTGAGGKPVLEHAPLEFNLSHSGDIALIAVTLARQVGVDVEQLRPLPDLDALAARVCNERELRWIAGLANAHRERAFFALWTRKEALAKATGEGIAGIFRDDGAAPADTHDGWTLVEVSDLPGYAACVAAEGTGWRLVRRTVTGSNEGR